MKTIRIKTRLKQIFAAGLAAVALMNSHPASATPLAGWTAGVPELTGFGPSPWAPTSVNPNLTVVGITRGAGLLTNGTPATFAWGADGWSLTTEAVGITSNLVATFSITAMPGYTTSITNIPVWNYRRLTNGPSTGTLAFSLNGGAYTEVVTNTYTVTSTAGGNVGPIAITNAGLQNIPPGTVVTFRICNYGAFNSTGTWYIYDPTTGPNDFELDGTLVSSGVAPTNLVVTPLSITTNSGATVAYTVVAGGDPATYAWYSVISSATNLIAGATNATLTLTGVTEGGNQGQYFVVMTNVYGAATSSPVSLTVTDPALLLPPSNFQGLLGQTANFIVSAAGTSLTYQWYYTDNNSNITAAVANGTPSYSSSTISGANAAELSIAGLTATDPTNFVVVISNSFGNSITSPVASLVSVGTTADLAFWNFNGNYFSNNIANPPTYYGIGTASGLGTDVPFSGSVDAADGAGLSGFGLGGPPYLSWGASPWPAPGVSNLLCGVQFLTSTLGANQIKVSYDARGTGTASAFWQMQYTTDAVTWIDYPASTTFGTPTNIPTTVSSTNSFGVSGYTTSSYVSFNNYDFTGFQGVDNNPNFGIRIVIESVNLATYGASPNTNYYGISNFQEGAGTMSYDLVTISGTVLTNFSAPPVIAAMTNVTMNDFTPVTVNLSVDDPNVVLTASTVGSANGLGLPRPLGPLQLGPSQFVFSGTTNMTITAFQSVDGIEPVIVTATDTNTGLSGSTWFYLNVTGLNPPPTNSLVGYPGTNTLAGTPLTIPFKASSANTPSNGFTYTASSANNTLIPSGNITFLNTTGGNPSVVITPAAGQLGVAQITVNVTDSGVTYLGQPNVDIKTTSATFDVQVRPNTNIVLIDYFNYDASGSLSAIDPGLWTHLSGNAGQMQVGGGYVTVDTKDNTENLQALLLVQGVGTNKTYVTNTNAVLYASFIVNMDMAALGNLPVVNGSYFANFNDGSGNTANVTSKVMAATNNAAPGDYRLGIANVSADSTGAQMFPMDLVPGVNYAVVVKLVVSNNFGTIWVAPTGPSSPTVTDTTKVSPLLNIAQFEFRESGTNAGAVSVAKLKVGTTFDSVFPSLKIASAGTNVVLTSSDPTLGIQVSTNNVSGPYTDIATGTPFTNAIGTNSAQYYRFGQ